MNMFSLRTIIDDILLLVRNNNISESEDLSRVLIASWILSYKAYFTKKKNDEDKANGTEDESSLLSMKRTYGPLELEPVKASDGTPLFRKKTKFKIPKLLDSDETNLYSVFDQEGCPIQITNEHRRHFHYFRKYTFGELTAWYENDEHGDGFIYVGGLNDCGHLKYIYISGLFEDDPDDIDDEDKVQIPGWMIPDIKNAILTRELAFMINRISDDDNNSTLDGIKPQPQTAIANEK